MQLQSSLHFPVLSVKVLFLILLLVRAQLSPAKVHDIWVPVHVHPEDPGLWLSSQLFSILQSKACHLQLRSQGRHSTPGAPKVMCLLHLHSPLKGMTCRTLVGDAGESLSMSHKNAFKSVVHRKDMACVPSSISLLTISQSQTPVLHWSSLGLGTHLG